MLEHIIKTSSVALLLAIGLCSCGETPDDDSTNHAALASSADTEPERDEAHCERAAERARESKPHKVSICHIPPGNPDNAHTINISKKAVDAHLAHGDVLGACGCTPDDSSEVPPTGDGGTSGGGEPGENPPPAPSPSSGSSEPTDGTVPEDGTQGGGENPPSTDVCDQDQNRCELSSDCGDNRACDYGCCVEIIL